MTAGLEADLEKAGGDSSGNRPKRSVGGLLPYSPFFVQEGIPCAESAATIIDEICDGIHLKADPYLNGFIIHDQRPSSVTIT
jgi:hypothetical protein